MYPFCTPQSNIGRKSKNVHNHPNMSESGNPRQLDRSRRRGRLIANSNRLI